MENGFSKGIRSLDMLRRILPEGNRLFVWCYDYSGCIKETTCPDPSWAGFFEHLKGKEKLRWTKEGQKVPHLIGSSIGLNWAAVYEDRREPNLIFLLGPFFLSQPVPEEIRRSLPAAAWASSLLRTMDQIPVIPFGVLVHYVILLHNSLNDDHLDTSVFMEAPDTIVPLTLPDIRRDRAQIYEAEQAILRHVREGDLNYRFALELSSTLSPGVPVHGKDPLRSAKTSIIVFTSLVCRAAMEGGLSPEVAYPLGDSYIQAAEDCRDSSDLTPLAMAMYHDFIFRVHQLRSGPAYTPVIQKCCDYIELSSDHPVSARELSALTGYTEYYLTDKFKKETGISVSQYVRRARIERVKMLLSSTSLSIQEIADQLHFNTPNYLIRCFREETGLTPAAFRKLRKEEDHQSRS